jgi:hypothetical protein
MIPLACVHSRVPCEMATGSEGAITGRAYMLLFVGSVRRRLGCAIAGGRVDRQGRLTRDGRRAVRRSGREL